MHLWSVSVTIVNLGFKAVSCCSVTKSYLTLCDPMDCSTSVSSLSSVSQSLLRFMSIESVMLSNHLILCHALSLLPSIFLSIRIFSSESALHIRWSKYWSFSFSITPSNEYSGLIPFRIDWFNLLAVQKSLLQHHSLKTSVLQHSAFFMVPFSHAYMNTGRIITLSKWIFLTQWYK